MRIDGTEKVLSATITFSNAQGPEGSYKHIQIFDEVSGLTIARIDMKHEAFGVALSSISTHRSNCSIRLIKNENFGKEEVRKTEEVVVQWKDYESDARRKELIEAVKPFEVDGWVADLYINSKRHCHKTNKYPVIFRRYVNKEDNNESN